MLNILALLLAMATVTLAQTSVTPAGTGTSANPYQIDSLPNLYWLSQTSSAWDDTLEQTSDIDASETSGWNANEGFMPIGNSTTTFKGDYNGKGHTIRGLSINRPETDFIALFGHLGHGAVVDSLSVQLANIVGKDFTGILVGYNAGTIKHSNTSGTVTGNTSAGGLIGRDSAATVVLSYSTATVNGENNVGGLVGDHIGKGVISESYATGSVIGGAEASNYSAGGLVGYNASETTIRNSYALGRVLGNAAVGGFVGSNYGLIENSYSIGRVMTTGTSDLIFGFTTNNNDIGRTTACLWDVSTSGTDFSKGGEAHTTLEMQEQSNFTGWDFAGTWAIAAGVNGGYPFLQGMEYAPGVTTEEVSNKGFNSGTGNGSITYVSKSGISSHGFCWNTTGMPTISDSKVDLGATTKIETFTGSLTDLNESTTYYVRAFATNSTGTSYGEEVSYTTLADKPIVITTDAYSIRQTKAVVKGNLSDLGASDVTSYGFCWNTTGAPTITDENVDLGGMIMPSSFSDTLSSLSKGTTFYVRAYAINASGIRYGDDASFATPNFTGTGTGIDPFQIATLVDLEFLSQNPAYWADSFMQVADIEATETRLWNSDSGFAPIGNKVTAFTGTYNGKKHEIRGLYINRSDDFVGLFGNVGTGGVIDSLGVVGDSVISSGRYFVGGIAGRNGGVISNSSYKGTVSGQGTHVGGVVGFNNSGTIINCSNAGIVTGKGTYVGGVTGMNNFGNIQSSYNLGSVYGVGTGYAGGVTGMNTGDLSQSYNTGNVIGSSFMYVAGGIVGYNGGSGVIANSYNTGNVTVSSNAFAGGGVTAYNYQGGVITSCYSAGNVSTSGNANAYGLAFNEGSIYISFWNQDSVSSDNGVGAGLTTTQMLSTKPFTDETWDFTNIWVQYEDHTYPLLRVFMDTLTVTAKDSTKIYDGKSFLGNNGFTYSLPGASAQVFGTSVDTGSSQGAKYPGSGYTIKPSGLWSNQLGYRIGYETGFLTILPYPITVTAEAKSIKKGSANVPLTYNASALLDGDEFTGALTREKGDTVGTYKILQGTLSAGDNYKITFKNANYVIAPKTVAIDPVVPQRAFTGLTNAHIYNMQGVQVWSGELDVNEGKFTMPNIGTGQWVVKLQMRNATKTMNVIMR